MSHPVPTRTYEDDFLGQWSDEELEQLFDKYKLECQQEGTHADMSDFIVWLEERY